MKKELLILLVVLCSTLSFGQTVFSEDFDNIPGDVSGGNGTYVFPSGWSLFDVDNQTPNNVVSYVTDAWIRSQDLNNTSDTVAVSTSWYSPAGTSNDWMWTPSIAVPSAGKLKWNAMAIDMDYPDGYEVRIMVAPNVPTGGPNNIGNLESNSTILFSISAENSAWTSREVSLSAYAGMNVYIGFRNNSTDQFILYLDDVEVSADLPFDAAVVPASVGHGKYSMAPANQINSLQNFSLVGSIKNEGSNSLSNVKLGCNVYLNSSLLTSLQSPPLASLTSGSTHDAVITYVPTTEGLYDFEFFPITNETDGNTTNDTVLGSNSFQLENDRMKRDDRIINGALGIGAGNGGYLGQTFNLTSAVNVHTVSVHYTAGYLGGEKLGVAIFNTDGNGVPTTLLTTTDTLVYATLDSALYTIPLANGPMNFAPGKYAFMVIEFDSILQLSNSINIFETNSVFAAWPTNPNGANAFTPVENFGANFARTFLINPNFVAADASVNELQVANLSVYPNPVVDYLTIESETENVENVRISDMTGKLIETVNAKNGKVEVDMRKYVNGTYMVAVKTTRQTYVSPIVKR